MAAKVKEQEEETRRNVSATAKHVRISARKLRLVADLVRGQDIARARTTLSFSPKNGAKVIDKLIASATANAENNHDMSADELFVKSIYVNEGPTMRRYRARALGRAYRIRKRTSHVTVELASREEG